MKAEINWSVGVRFDALSQTGHKITMDGSPDHGGENAGARPMELLLIGMGGCTAFDVVGILKKARADLQDMQIELQADRADEVPSVFTKIHVHFILKGAGLKESLVKRAIELSAEKYCSASIMLGQTAKITHSFEIIERAA
ncbi:MAG: OsmC family protein [Hyphomicrobiaceae bacterium]|nr:OsmC family protein [Hyphomicrobiaceae bacterium]